MPIYTYKCPDCGWKDEQHRPLEDRNKAITCRQCGGPMKRTFQPASISIEGRAYVEYGGDPNDWWD